MSQEFLEEFEKMSGFDDNDGGGFGDDFNFDDGDEMTNKKEESNLDELETPVQGGFLGLDQLTPRKEDPKPTVVAEKPAAKIETPNTIISGSQPPVESRGQKQPAIKVNAVPEMQSDIDLSDDE
jgi:hypothetical protein